MGAQKNRLIETVLFEYPQHMFWLRKTKLIFNYTHLSRVLITNEFHNKKGLNKIITGTNMVGLTRLHKQSATLCVIPVKIYKMTSHELQHEINIVGYLLIKQI